VKYACGSKPRRPGHKRDVFPVNLSSYEARKNCKDITSYQRFHSALGSYLWGLRARSMYMSVRSLDCAAAAAAAGDAVTTAGRRLERIVLRATNN